MREWNCLTRRALKIFWRTKGNLLFASLSVLILLVLHFMIFRNMYTDSWLQIASALPSEIPRADIAYMVDLQMFAAVIPIGAVSISLVALSLMVADRETGALSDFLVAPIRRNSLMASYLISSFVAGFAILLGFILLFEVYFLITAGQGFGLLQLLLILLSVVGSLIFANVFMLLLISFFRKQQMLGAAGTIIGTLLGFLSGAYVPVTQFGDAVANLFSALPFLQLTVLCRKAFLYGIGNSTAIPEDWFTGDLGRTFGTVVEIGAHQVPLWGVGLWCAAFTLVLLGGLGFRFARMKRS